MIIRKKYYCSISVKKTKIDFYRSSINDRKINYWKPKIVENTNPPH